LARNLTCTRHRIGDHIPALEQALALVWVLELELESGLELGLELELALGQVWVLELELESELELELELGQALVRSSELVSPG